MNKIWYRLYHFFISKTKYCFLFQISSQTKTSSLWPSFFSLTISYRNKSSSSDVFYSMRVVVHSKSYIRQEMSEGTFLLVFKQSRLCMYKRNWENETFYNLCCVRVKLIMFLTGSKTNIDLTQLWSKHWHRMTRMDIPNTFLYIFFD